MTKKETSTITINKNLIKRLKLFAFVERNMKLQDLAEEIIKNFLISNEKKGFF